MNDIIKNSFSDHIEIVKAQSSGDSSEVLCSIAERIIGAFKNGKKVIMFGNGGSAADAQHIAAEFIGRFQQERYALPAIALCTNTSNLTCISNDYGFEHVFERQVEALGKNGDISIGFSTSGGSVNVINAQKKAKELGLCTVAFIGKKSSPLESICDIVYKVPSDNTARIQESHILASHILCNVVERSLFKDEN
ncbi:MAG: D-sedoheptulose 7-phosphate isomerase [Candidatus Aureabacteria bacterium]|nr:D-sedoheptulose 7-phosphate isomerase [Candidatus Auribacterota bacterium]